VHQAFRSVVLGILTPPTIDALCAFTDVWLLAQ